MPPQPQARPSTPSSRGLALPTLPGVTYATAAAQIKGAWDEDGRGPSICDTFSRLPGKIRDGSTPSDACNAYHLWKEDATRMKEYGARAYGFSLSCSLIIPLGGEADPINEAGLAFYALYERYGGMLDKQRYTADFMRYARLCFERFGDRVKHWITYNEPGLTARAGYAQGRNAPGHASDTEPWIVGHTELVSHGDALRDGCIMITLDGNWYEPWDENDAKDVEAAERTKEFEISGFADPVYGTGDYPASMRPPLGDRLPQFIQDEKRVVRGSLEVYGMNPFTTFYARHLEGAPERSDYRGNVEFLNENRNGKPRGPDCSAGWARYGVAICITDNGTTVKGEHEGPAPAAPGEIVEDPFRAGVFRAYLAEVAKACQEAVVIKSYWVTWIDYASPQKTRHAKRSAYALREYFEFLIAR
ncbi:glycoside hydrolase superfamily [Aspergillus pseudodeflectus]|uniref:Glycoside hydrolase superfamily n=1 Tax=Aspergillus pseudodeflectus TaxID=176178 RepID=A0ABR4KWR0_9EURO